VTLTAKDVAEITRLLEQSSFDELYLELDGVKLSLKRNGAAAGRAAGSGGGAAAPMGSSAGSPAPAQPAGGSGAPLPATSIGATGSLIAATSLGAAAPSGASAPLGASAAPGGAAAPDAANLHNVTSPLLGTYYRAPKPGAPPYVEVGSLVAEDTIIGIIEVMKLMNTVRAGVRGRVTEILARDGALVEYGETVLRIAKSD
jgi:acetyl-CoA carboxylase biotin carboxyl carrier protein